MTGQLRRIAVLISLGLMLLAGSEARAADEQVSLSLNAQPGSAGLFREVARPVSAGLHITVQVPEGQAKVVPMINSRVDFPEDMQFDPDPNVTPACPETKIGPQTNLGMGIAGVVAICPESVVGTGRADIALAQSVSFPLGDPQLVVFNAGKTDAGQPKITIYGFSKGAGAGLLMSGFLAEDGKLDIAIGVLPFDSSVTDFTLGIPGEPLVLQDGKAPDGSNTIVGQDPGFLVAKCSTGQWTATGEFSFATRDQSTSELTSPVTEIRSNESSLPCEGRAGSPKISISKAGELRGSRTAKSRTYQLKVRNAGTASSSRLKLKVSGAGKGSVSMRVMKPGEELKVKVRVHPTVKRSRGRKLRFELTGKGIRASKLIAF